MLRITEVQDDGSGVTLKLEGQISGDWVSVLEQECLRLLGTRGVVVLDFESVLYISEAGVAMLNRLPAEKLRLINCSPFVKDLLAGSKGHE